MLGASFMAMHESVMDPDIYLQESHPALCTDAVLACVFAALPGPADVAAAARTCKQWRRACNFDAVWKALHVRDYGWPDEAEMCCSFRDQYRRAMRLASGTQQARGTPLFGQDTYTTSVAYDPVTGCLATVHAFPFGRLSVQVTVLEVPPTPPPPSLSWDVQQMPVGHSYTLYSDEMGAIMVRAFRPIAAHSGRCVYARGGSVLAVASLRPDGAVLGELNVLTTEIAALVMNSWMCISVSSSGEALFWSLDRLARFGRQPLGFFLRTGPGLPSWAHRVAMAPEAGVQGTGPGPSSAKNTSTKSSLVAIVNFDRTEGPHVLVLRAERTSDASGGRLSTLQVLGFSNPTSCCFSRGRLVVGSCISRSAQSFYYFTGLVHMYDTVSWEKLGMLVSTEQRTIIPQALLASSPRVHVTGGSVVFEVPRDGLAEQFVLQFRPQHAVCAMNLHDLKASNGSRHLVLSPEDRSPTTTLVENEEEWMEVTMLLSTPSRLLMLTKLQTLLEVPLL